MPAARRSPMFEVRPSSIHGLGVFATRRIRAGTRILEYVGEIITDDEADRRYDDSSVPVSHTFLFGVGGGKCIDAGVGGNESRFINHSCDPNCASTQEGKRIFIEALQTIQPGVELKYDYRLDRKVPLERSWKRLYACRCGAPNCRGTLLAPLPKRRKRAKPSRR